MLSKVISPIFLVLILAAAYLALPSIDGTVPSIFTVTYLIRLPKFFPRAIVIFPILATH